MGTVPIYLLAALCAFGFGTAEAQQPRHTRTIGVLAPQPLAQMPYYPNFLAGLRQLGYQPDRDLRILFRSAEGKFDRLSGLADELVAARVDLIVAFNTPGTRAAVKATKDIPIVFSGVADPVGFGFVTNLPRPGGNVTGVSNQAAELSGKRLGLLKEIVPKARRIAALYNPEDPITAQQIKDTERAARSLRLDVSFYPVRTNTDVPSAFKQLLEWRADAALWLVGQQQAFQAATIKLADTHRMPLMVGQRIDVERGGLVSYFPDSAEIYQRTVAYVDQILKGAKPGDLPVQQPTKFEFAINLKTARLLGLTISKELAARADSLIE
jgi:putative ABC transport system substrate-binding protein